MAAATTESGRKGPQSNKGDRSALQRKPRFPGTDSRPHVVGKRWVHCKSGVYRVELTDSRRPQPLPSRDTPTGLLMLCQGVETRLCTKTPGLSPAHKKLDHA